MPGESVTRQGLLQALRETGFDAMAVENDTMPGTPDVNWCFKALPLVRCCEGWIECKRIEAWPKRLTTPVRIDNFTEKQRIWIRRRAEHGGRVHFLLHVGRDERLLFDGVWAADNIGIRHQADLRWHALAVWKGLGRDELVRVLLSSTS